MENIKYIDITQLPDDLWQDAKNVIALDSNGEVIKAAKEDTYSKEEIDDLLKDAEISADKLQNKIKIDSASTDYVVTQPTVSGDSLVITDSMSDKNQYHTFGYDKSFTVINNGLLNTSTPLYRGTNDYNCPKWDGNSIKFQYSAGYSVGVRLSIPYTYNGVKYVTHIDTTVSSSYRINIEFGEINDQNFVGYQSVPFKQSEVYKAFGANETFVFKKNDVSLDYYNLESTYSSYVFPSDTIEMTIANFPLSNGALIIENPRFYILSNNFIYGDVPTENYTYDHPEKLNDYIRYSNDVKAYILTDKNTKFKTINGEQITGDGNIEISTDVDISNLATKSELATKQDKLVSGTNIKSINGTSLLSSGNMELATKAELNTKQDVITDLDAIRSGAAKGATALQSVPSEYATEQWVNEQGFLKEHQDISNLATKEELNTKQDVITDLDAIRSGAALGATALQSVPDTYALKSEIPDITNIATKAELNEKQDTLVSGSNIKTVNGESLLGSGNIVIEASAENVPTVQTDKQGTTNNYIYSSGQKDKYGVISDFYTAISYEQGRASIHTDWYYWGNTEQYMIDGSAGWSIEGATASQAGLMSASDKTKLDGIDLSTKQDKLVSGTNIKTVNGESLLGSGNIVIDASADNVPTVQTTPNGTTSNYIYSTISHTNPQYSVISDISNFITYSTDKASIATYQRYWGQESANSHQNWSINAATTSQAGLMTASDKTKLDGIDLTTKQDTLVSGENIKTVNGTSLLGSGNITIDNVKEWVGTQAEYNALTEKDNNTTYYITE